MVDPMFPVLPFRILTKPSCIHEEPWSAVTPKSGSQDCLFLQYTSAAALGIVSNRPILTMVFPAYWGVIEVKGLWKAY